MPAGIIILKRQDLPPQHKLKESETTEMTIVLSGKNRGKNQEGCKN